MEETTEITILKEIKENSLNYARNSQDANTVYEWLKVYDFARDILKYGEDE